MKAVFIILCLSIIALNIVILVKLRPKLNFKISTDNIQIGFFNSSEISLIQNGTFEKTSTFDDQLIGNLSDIIYSPDKVFDHRECYNDKNFRSIQTCTDYFMHTFSIQIICNQKSQQFLQDCVNSNNINIVMKYFENAYLYYPTYNCMVKTNSSNACSSCSQLL